MLEVNGQRHLVEPSGRRLLAVLRDDLELLGTKLACGEGACGAVVFTWTDDWWRGGRAVDDWAFGLVDSDRRPKPAYEAVRRAFDAPGRRRLHGRNSCSNRSQNVTALAQVMRHSRAGGA